MKKFRAYCIRLYCILCLLPVCLCGCGSADGDTSSGDTLEEQGYTLVYDATASPNEEYIEDEADKVTYTVQIYQNQKHSIVVCAQSNSDFFEDMQYEVAYSAALSESDCEVVWTTLMGNTKYTEEDQLAVAYVTLSADGEVFSERKINFVDGAITIVTDTINQTTKEPTE